MFDNKYMKLFDARSNVIHTFSLHTKQFLFASNIDFLDMMEIPSYFVLPLWCIKQPNIVLDLMHLKNNASIYQQPFMELRKRYRDYIPVYIDGSQDGNSVACTTGFPPDAIIFM